MPMDSGYLGLIVLIGIAAFVCALMVFGSWLLGPKKKTPYKESPYECGVAPVGSARERFPVKFYLVAIIFVLFDIEVVFLWSWMTVFKNADRAYMVFSFWAVAIYMLLWILGDAYAMRVGAIDWDETTSLPEEKLASSSLETAAPHAAILGGGS